MKRRTDLPSPKPRLSMKLLWQYAINFDENKAIKALGEGKAPSIVPAFLMYVENKMKPLKP